MSIADQQLEQLRQQINAGFLIEKPRVESGIYYFNFPALEAMYTIGVHESEALQTFLASDDYKSALLVPMRIGVALLDIVGFSIQPDDGQVKMIVRYQSLIHKVLKTKNVRKLISIGDGTIFVFEDAAIPDMVQTLFELDHELAGFNLDFGENDGVPEIHRRIGVHVGQAYRIKDINGEENYIGTAMNMAQRVSTCVPTGDDLASTAPGLISTIYVSDAARASFQEAGLPPGFSFIDAGNKTIKHGQSIHVYALQKCTSAQ